MNPYEQYLENIRGDQKPIENQTINKQLDQTDIPIDKDYLKNTQSNNRYMQYLNEARSEAENEPKKDIFKQEQEKQETPRELEKRTKKRMFFRGAALMGGIPHMLGEISAAVPAYLHEKITGKPPGETAKSIYKNTVGLAQYLPSSEEILDSYKFIFGKEDLSPHSKKEAIADEMQDDILLQLPFGGNVVRNVATPVLGQAAKQIAKGLGASEQTQDNIKVATMFMLGLWNPRATHDLYQCYYGAADQLIPETVTGDAALLHNQMTTLNHEVSMGGGAASEVPIQNATQTVVDRINDNQGQLSYQQARALKRSFNEEMSNTGYTPAGPGSKTRARALYGRVNDALENFISTSERNHPEFYAAHQAADNIYSTLAGSRYITNFFKRLSGVAKVSGISSAVAGMYFFPLQGAIAGTAGLAGLQSMQLINHVIRSPELRNLYIQTLYNAGRQNSLLVLKNMEKMQDELKKDKQVADILKDTGIRQRT